MFMDSIFRDTVASICSLNEIQTSLIVMTLLAGVQPCVGTTASPHLTSYPESASDGADFTLSCTPTTEQSKTFISAAWFRNNVNIFDTSSDSEVSAVILNNFTTSPEYQSVSGRISVNSSPQQFNMTLWANSTLDKGSVWTCKTGSQFSNNLTIDVKESIQGPSTTKGPSSTDDKTTMTTTSTPIEFIYAVAGSGGGVVIVVVIVIVVLLCIRSRREDKCQTIDKTEKDNCKEGGYNEESERETIVMEDNDLYHGFVRTENQESAEEQQVRDVYAKVNKVRKTHNATEVQITLSIEDLYAKPNKPASGNSEAASKVSSNQNEDVNTPD
ncbi:uncharacterized protein LOC124117303 isoform X2 [Haliotis rufescens]|uniref:uncharacterized protein LOC124117303 isoform X2 n=1 Tax=Haliotis rufescens TaxID=6454 RepID=UPI00201EE3CC|nr:uncharacterized protein LOC124117303 isoform X2 [Haliotis rufescens]